MQKSKTVVIVFDRTHINVLGIYDNQHTKVDDAILFGTMSGNVLAVTFDEDKSNKGCYVLNPRTDFIPYAEMDAVG